MLDWLTWPADQLLRIGGVVAGWFFSKDATSFTVVQMMFATLVLAAFVALLVFWPISLENPFKQAQPEAVRANHG